MTTETSAGPRGRMTVGIVFIALGLTLTLAEAGVLNVDGIGRFWPLLIIGIGIVKVRQPMEDGQRALGAALLLVGGLFQVLAVVSWGRAWPLMLVGAGGLLLWQAIERPRAAEPAPKSSYLSELVLLGGTKRALRIPDFRGGFLTAVLGGVELDLRHCGIVTSPATIDVVAFWGGIDLKVPAEWRVEGKVVPVMGGFEQKTPPAVESDDSPRLIVRGYAIMGGVVIGN